MILRRHPATPQQLLGVSFFESRRRNSNTPRPHRPRAAAVSAISGLQAASTCRFDAATARGEWLAALATLPVLERKPRLTAHEREGYRRRAVDVVIQHVAEWDTAVRLVAAIRAPGGLAAVANANASGRSASFTFAGRAGPSRHEVEALLRRASRRNEWRLALLALSKISPHDMSTAAAASQSLDYARLALAAGPPWMTAIAVARYGWAGTAGSSEARQQLLSTLALNALRSPDGQRVGVGIACRMAELGLRPSGAVVAALPAIYAARLATAGAVSVPDAIDAMRATTDWAGALTLGACVWPTAGQHDRIHMASIALNRVASASARKAGPIDVPRTPQLLALLHLAHDTCRGSHRELSSMAARTLRHAAASEPQSIAAVQKWMRARQVALDFDQRAHSPFEAGSSLRNTAAWAAALDTLALMRPHTADTVALNCALRFCAERRVVTLPFSTSGLSMFRALEVRRTLDSHLGIHVVRLARDWQTALSALSAISSTAGSIDNNSVYEYITTFPAQWQHAAVLFARSHRDGVLHGLLAIGARRFPGVSNDT